MLLLLIWGLAAPYTVQAENILDYLPEDALGFVLIRDLAGASEQCEHLMRMFEVESPAPLELVKLTTGLSEGLRLNGDVLAALLPGSQPTDPPEPLVVLPIADYAKFAASINGDETGEVCRVTISGEDVLVARHGPYAMLMNVESRETLEILVGLEPAPVKLVEPWSQWLQANEATLAVLPPGVIKLRQMAGQHLALQQRQWNQEFGEPEFADVLTQLQQSLSFYHTVLSLLGTRIHAAAVGVSLSEANDLRFGLRIMEISPPKNFVAAPTAATASPLAGYPDRPFVFAGGGPTGAGLVQALLRTSMFLMRRSPEAYGYQNFDDQAWQDLEASYRDVLSGIRSVTVLMQTGEKGDPLFGNVYSIATVDNAAEFLQTYRKSVETWNRLEAQSASDIQMVYELHDIKVGGAEACEMLVDVAAAARDPNVPMFNWMLESLFGKEGKMRVLLVAADERTIVVGLADEAEMTKAIELVKQQEQGLQNSADVQTTTKLLAPEAAWKFYVSPQGCVTWYQRVMDELFGQIIQQPLNLPEYTAGPPVGVSLHAHESHLNAEVVWPGQSLPALAEFIKKSEEP